MERPTAPRTIDLGAADFETYCEYVFRHNEMHHRDSAWKATVSSSTTVLKHLIRLFNEAAAVVESFTTRETYEAFSYISGPYAEFGLPADGTIDLKLR